MKNYEPLTIARKAEATELLVSQGMTPFGATYKINSIDNHALENDLTFLDASVEFERIDRLYQMPISAMHKAS